MHFSSLLITLPRFLLIIFARVFPIGFHTPPATPAGTTGSILHHAAGSLSAGIRPVFSRYKLSSRRRINVLPVGGLFVIYRKFRAPVPTRSASSSSVHPVRFLIADTQSFGQCQKSGVFKNALLIYHPFYLIFPILYLTLVFDISPVLYFYQKEEL